MRKLTYLAVLEPSKDGYGVYYPDLPGCISTGNDIEDAQKNAKEALELHVYGMEKGNKKLPLPTYSLKTKDIEGRIVTPITIFPDIVRNDQDNRRVKTNVTIPLWLKDKAEASGVNYSRLLEVSLMDYLGLTGKDLRS
ncbi:type II toxin-antitoxin system HicB family antitoxin [Anaerocolumna sp. MB42-C2]|uniref:type II toxin-antitoxin system HicB family antitoxin n=1 Tax=Anaerocolumna sp. MB42-C2 TaxID=3070997 RepID=UPI0027E1B4CE|nr:type II toxin-antitoxin system HicB family antitoxin [Anaerocolumna sp. MB42-C2]WMJ88906.1 type II toxin-antitoxin system HicB family antitoxin [Anaerocolumna sp. MB42-C2]